MYLILKHLNMYENKLDSYMDFQTITTREVTFTKRNS